jgi:hypothetical protein
MFLVIGNFLISKSSTAFFSPLNACIKGSVVYAIEIIVAGLVDDEQRFRETCCPHLQGTSNLRMDAVDARDILLSTSQTVSHPIRQYSS